MKSAIKRAIRNAAKNAIKKAMMNAINNAIKDDHKKTAPQKAIMQAMGSNEGSKLCRAAKSRNPTSTQPCLSRTFCKVKLAQDRKAGPFYTTDVQEQPAVRGSAATVSTIYLHRTAGPLYSTAARSYLVNII